MKHATPRPWKRGKAGKRAQFIIAMGDGSQPTRTIAELWYGSFSSQERSANADLIVMAVNAHDTLTEAMKKACALLAKGRKVGRERQIGELALEAENILLEALDVLKEA
jgi:hypothetical protein